MLLTKVQIHYLHLNYIYYIRMVCALLSSMYIVIRLSANEYEGTVIMAGSTEGGKVQVPSADPMGQETCWSCQIWLRFMPIGPASGPACGQCTDKYIDCLKSSSVQVCVLKFGRPEPGSHWSSYQSDLHLHLTEPGPVVSGSGLVPSGPNDFWV